MKESWIKVVDELPPKGVVVIVYYPDYLAREGTKWEHIEKGFQEICAYEPDIYDKPVWFHAYYDYSMPSNRWPSHWMPLPDKPKD